jgi:hypothetical protein
MTGKAHPLAAGTYMMLPPRTYVTAPEVFAAIRQLGQKTRDGQWRYTLRPVKRETANS